MAWEAGPNLRRISRSELSRMDGYRGAPKCVAWKGIVYDVSNCPKWQSGLHENLHFPGQDLTEVFAEAPHGKEVFDYPCVRRVGILVND